MDNQGAFGVSAYGVTDPGLVRSQNEDTFLVWTERRVFAVADGMGGQAAGELASQFFVQAVRKVFEERLPQGIEEVTQRVKKAFWEAHREILAHVSLHQEHQGMGCTAELLVLTPEIFCVGHIGDSRTYLFRGGNLYRLTKDHSLVQKQIEAGVLTEEEARRHPMRNVVLRALGVREDLALDLVRGEIEKDDLFLLCSDGLTDMIPDSLLRGYLYQASEDLAKLGNLLIEKAKQAGGKDNITVILVRVK